jgi:hypothetical protein
VENELCTNCDLPEDECDCVTCEECDDPVNTFAACGENHCEGCCTCPRCPGCGRWNTNRCGHDLEIRSCCNQCQNCCDCIFCDSCGAAVDGTCDNCNNCSDCCECESGECEILTSGIFRFWTAKKTEHKLNPFDRHISLEIEIASCSNTYQVERTCDKWGDAIVEDGSLPDAGFEINTNPSSGDVFLRHIDEVCSSLESARVNSACGMHCHIGAPDYRWFDLFKLCRLYSKIEDALYSLIPPSRRINRYCIPCADKFTFTSPATFKQDLLLALYDRTFPAKHAKPTKEERKNRKSLEAQLADLEVARDLAADKMNAARDAYYALDWTTKETVRAKASELYQKMYSEWDRLNTEHYVLYVMLNSGSQPETITKTINGKEKKVFSERGDKYNPARYSGLNLHSFFYRGTIAEKAKNWGMICAAIIDYAAKNSLSRIDALPADSWAALTAILPPFLATWAEVRKAEVNK